jgi:hypothetical protein
MKSRYICIALCALTVLACDQSANKQSANATPAPQTARSAEEEQEWQAPIEKIGVSDIYPTADGGAYVITPHGRLWYVKEHWAYRVSESKAPISRAKMPRPGAAFALLSAERRQVRQLKEELKSAQYKISELKEAQ